MKLPSRDALILIPGLPSRDMLHAWLLEFVLTSMVPSRIARFSTWFAVWSGLLLVVLRSQPTEKHLREPQRDSLHGQPPLDRPRPPATLRPLLSDVFSESVSLRVPCSSRYRWQSKT